MSKSDWSPLEEEVRRRVNEHFGAELPGAPDSGGRHPAVSAGEEGGGRASGSLPLFVLGVSGGPDSMALMYALHRLGLPALVAHVNYQKRGEASDRDAELVEELAFQWGFDCHTAAADPEEAEGENFQQWARDFRYDFFRALRRDHGCEGIAVAHHQDDQAETILQKLFRGAGLAGWQGMEVWDGELFRPLLRLSREDIERYLEEHEVPWRTDESNLKSDFARNFLRREWLPELERHFPGWKSNVLRAGDQAGIFQDALAWIGRRVSGERGGLNREALLSLEPGLAKALVLHRLRRELPGAPVSGNALDELEKLPELQTGKAIRLAEGVEVMRDRELFKIVVDTGQRSVSIPLEREALEQKAFTFDGLSFRVAGYRDPDFDCKLYLEAGALAWPLTLRRWREGDRFQPFGMEGTQLVSDHLTNRKVAADLRGRALVLEALDETIAAVIFPPSEKRLPPGTISEEVRCGPETGSCLVISRNK